MPTRSSLGCQYKLHYLETSVYCVAAKQTQTGAFDGGGGGHMSPVDFKKCQCRIFLSLVYRPQRTRLYLLCQFAIYSHHGFLDVHLPVIHKVFAISLTEILEQGLHCPNRSSFKAKFLLTLMSMGRNRFYFLL